MCPKGVEWIKKAFHFMTPAKNTLGYWWWAQTAESKAILARHAENRTELMTKHFEDPIDLAELIDQSE